MNDTNSTRILRIDASARHDDSVSRSLADAVMNRLMRQYPQARVIYRELSSGVAVVDEAWIDASFTEPGKRSQEQEGRLALSEELLSELESSDLLVLATPMYNFSIPAALKAWVDQVMRARRSFRYTPRGPEGLLADRPAYLLMATSGTRIGSEMDFASPYLCHVLGIMGIQDIRLVAADQMNTLGAESQQRAQREIAALFHRQTGEAA